MPGEPVAQAGLALTLDGPGVTVGANVLHDEARAVGLVAQAQVDVGRARVTAHVRQRLLRGAVHGQARLGAELARPAVEGEVAVDVGLLAERLRERGQALGPRHGLAPERLDRPPRLLQARAGEAVAALDRVRHVRVRAARACEQPRALELDGERGERMGEDVVHLPREPRPFAQLHRLRVRLAGRLQLGDGLLRLLQPLARRAHAVAHDEEERPDGIPDEDVGEGRLVVGQHVDRADRHHAGHEAEQRLPRAQLHADDPQRHVERQEPGAVRLQRS